jgi:hypothetical protein
VCLGDLLYIKQSLEKYMTQSLMTAGEDQFIENKAKVKILNKD